MRITLAALLVLTASSQAFASPLGEWTVKDKSARVAITNCGVDLCGKLSWTQDGKDLGQPVLIDMKPDGERWTGTVVDVRNGRRYTAHIALKRDDLLKLDGCVLGGLICSGEMWTRYVPPVAPMANPAKIARKH